MAMVIHITPHTDEIIEKIRQNKKIALTAAATEAQEGIKECMIGGYARPVYDTGTLYGDVQFDFKDENTVEVGSTKDYAPYVHEGTYKMAGRPYVRDGMLGSQQEILSVFVYKNRRKPKPSPVRGWVFFR